MRYSILKISFITSLILLGHFYSFGQTDSIKINDIRSHIKQVDSLLDSPDKKYLVTNFLEEGKISKEVVTTQIVRHKNKIDTLKSKIWGGWSKSNYQNYKGDTLFKVEYHDNLQKNFYLTFYFKNNNLVYGKVEYQENGIGKTFYQREEYYNGNKIVLVTETKKDLDDDYKRRAVYSLYKRGQEYLEDFKKQR